jgi:phospholipid/cholesterol/gamma-HCH transport system substrate-binding protein
MARRTLFSGLLVSAFAALCLAGIAYFAVNMGMTGPWSRDFKLDAVFDSANGLVTQSEVRVSGVHVGRVVEINGAGTSGALVTMHLQPDIQLHRDIRLVIRPKTLLGEKFVEIVRPRESSQPMLKPGSVIPRAQTGQAVEIDDILSSMDPDTRKAMTESFRQLGIAFDGRESDLNSMLPPLDATIANFRPLARVGEARQKELDRILKNLSIIMQALADEQEQLGRLVDSGDKAMTAIASRDRELAGTVRNAAAVFESLDKAFQDLTPANRASLQKSPPTIAAGRRMLALTNPQVDKLLPEFLLAEITYPNNQLSITDSESLVLAAEWISAFSQRDAATGYHALRITSINPSLVPPDAGTPQAPADLADLLLRLMGRQP